MVSFTHPWPETSITDLGWNSSWTDVAGEAQDLRPARVTLHGRDVWRVHDGVDELVVGVRGRLRHDDPAGLPVAGDWVLLGGTPASGIVVERVLPRRTALVRKVAGQRTDEQVVASNVDVVLVCAPVHSLNARRLERELTIAWESGARPVVAITKTDLVDDVPETTAEIAGIAIGVEVIAVSSFDGDGLSDVRALAPRGVTVAVIGPSGAGKSTLVNALVGEQVMATTAVRADHRGVHTTSARHLVPVPGGGLVLDTPGMRELSLWADEDALDAAFADIDDLAQQCRFNDCRHKTEPGCAVLAGIATGTLDEDRVAGWRKLQRELAFLARKQDVRLALEERRRWARVTQEARRRTRREP
jgi:ribosome biogenesis GTPase